MMKMKNRFSTIKGDKTGAMFDRQAKDFGTMEFANRTVKRRKKNDVAKVSRKKNR